MNLMLLPGADGEIVLPPGDSRAAHVRDVLRMRPGDQFDVGAINGPRGKALIAEDDPDGMRLTCTWGETPPPPFPITLLVGLPRPHTARRMLHECASIGAARLLFFDAKKGEPSYGESRLWKTDEWHQRLIKGAEQAFTTHLPDLQRFPSLAVALEAISPPPDTRLALDVYESTMRLHEGAPQSAVPTTIAIGPERGWSPDERDQLRDAGFTLTHLGERVLRAETACVAAVSITAARMGLL